MVNGAARAGGTSMRDAVYLAERRVICGKRTIGLMVTIVEANICAENCPGDFRRCTISHVFDPF